jgi:hypothetical protein
VRVNFDFMFLRPPSFSSPHLLSSPLGRGNSIRPVLVLRMTLRQIQLPEFSRRRRKIHPLLGGEGRGEDGRLINLIVFCARPHPNLLPRGEGTAIGRFLENTRTAMVSSQRDNRKLARHIVSGNSQNEIMS